MTGTPDIYVSKSALANASRCRRSHHYAYVLGARPVQRDPKMAIGSVLHDAFLEGYLGGDGHLDTMLHRMFNHPEKKVLRPPDLLVAESILTAAHQVFEPLKQSATVQSVEQELVRDHVWCNGDEPVDVRFTAQLDAVLVEDKPYIMELKTTRSRCDPASWYWDRARIDLQTWFYMLEARKAGIEVAELAWQVFKIPTLKRDRFDPAKESELGYIDRMVAQMTGDTETWFPFIPVYWDDGKAAAYQEDIDGLVDLMVWQHLQGGLPARNTGSCFDFNRRCEYYGVCHEGGSIENRNLYQLRVDREAQEQR